MSDLLTALRNCFQDTIFSNLFPLIMEKLSISSSDSSRESDGNHYEDDSNENSDGNGNYDKSSSNNNNETTNDNNKYNNSGNNTKVHVRASDFVHAISEIRPAVALNHDIVSMLVDNNIIDNIPVLYCVEDIQKRLKNTVLLPYTYKDDGNQNQSGISGNKLNKNNKIMRNLSRQKGLSLSHCSGKYRL